MELLKSSESRELINCGKDVDIVLRHRVGVGASGANVDFDLIVVAGGGDDSTEVSGWAHLNKLGQVEQGIDEDGNHIEGAEALEWAIKRRQKAIKQATDEFNKHIQRLDDLIAGLQAAKTKLRAMFDRDLALYETTKALKWGHPFLKEVFGDEYEQTAEEALDLWNTTVLVTEHAMEQIEEAK